MKPPDVFGIIGLVLLMFVGYAIWTVIFTPNPPIEMHGRGWMLSRLFAATLPCLVVGFIFTRKACWIESLCYPRRVQRRGGRGIRRTAGNV